MSGFNGTMLCDECYGKLVETAGEFECYCSFPRGTCAKCGKEIPFGTGSWITHNQEHVLMFFGDKS